MIKYENLLNYYIIVSYNQNLNYLITLIINKKDLVLNQKKQ